MVLDSAVIELLELSSDPTLTSVSSTGGGGCSSASTLKITTTVEDKDGKPVEKYFFMKTARGEQAKVMFRGEHASLSAIHTIVPTLCPRPHGHGTFASDPDHHFFITDWLHITSNITTSRENYLRRETASKLAKLHTTPAPTPPGFDRPMFGFPVTTCCGDTPQPNPFTASWADFFAEHRLRFILAHAAETRHVDAKLRELVDKTAGRVVPRLLGDDHLNGGKGVLPVVVHGDLWGGNVSRCRAPGEQRTEEIVYDASACYAHSEYELGIMQLFGGFGMSLMEEYHKLVPKSEPMDEFDDRVQLYELYHLLNHYALMGSDHYLQNAIKVMKSLVAKYGG